MGRFFHSCEFSPVNDARHALKKFLSDVIDMHIQVFSIIVSPLMIEFPGLRAIVCFRAPAGARLCHQGEPSTHHIIIRPVTLTMHPQPAHCVFPTSRSTFRFNLYVNNYFKAFKIYFVLKNTITWKAFNNNFNITENL